MAITETYGHNSLREEYNQGKNYLSFGGGVNSVALMLWLLDHDIEFEAVFADHGGDYPETYEYVDMLKNKGYEITVLKTKVKAHGIELPLYEYCLEYRIVPSTRFRWCTSKFKVQPLINYVQKPCFMMIGISTEESHRAYRRMDYYNNTVRDYPLIRHNINRNQCIEIIKQHGLPIPPKSGCFFCPFIKMSDWKAMVRRDDRLFCKAIALETANIARNKEVGSKLSGYISAKNIPLESIVQLDQVDMFFEPRPCECLV